MIASTAEVRLDVLEARVAQQDNVIEDLNAAITAQWRTLDVLRAQLARLDDRVADLGRSAPGAASEPAPPHY